MMKLCEKYASLLDAFVDGELTCQQEAEVRAHLGDCPACAAYVADALALRDAFPGLDEIEVPGGLADAVCAAIRADAAPQKKKKSRWAMPLISAAACAALVFAVWRVAPGFSGNGASAPSLASAPASSAAVEPRSGDSEEDFSSDAIAEGQLDSEEMDGALLGSSANPAETDNTMTSAAAQNDAPSPEVYGLLSPEAAQNTAGEAMPAEPEQSAAAEADIAALEFAEQALTPMAATETPAYQELLADLNGFTEAIWSGCTFSPIVHTENGTNIAWYGEAYGTPHTNQWVLYLSFGDGRVAGLPLPADGPFGSKAPDAMRFDGDTLVYEVTFADTEENTLVGKGYLHVAGTYHYTVDLTAETVSLDIQ